MEKNSLPIIIENETSGLKKNIESQFSSPTPHKGIGNRFKNLPKIAILIFGLIVLAEIIYGIKTFTTPTPTIGQVQPMTNGKLMLISSTNIYKIGSVIDVKLRVDTGGHTISGTDIILKYDPRLLEISSEFVETSGVFSEFPLKTVDKAAGEIRLSGIAGLSQNGFNGIGTMARLQFTVRAAGDTTLKLDFSPGLTTDSNIIESGSSQDILDSVKDLNLNLVQ